jgi:hypothetical protein
LLPERILYESDTLRIRYLGFADSPVCVVTFAHFSPSPRTRRRGFGEPFFLKQRISAVHVTCSGNDWYQYPDVAEIGRAVAPLRARYGRVVTYGSSMGGYAAILFAGDCGADAAIAASPQFSIDPRKIPYDAVRARDGARVRILRDELRVGDGTRVYLIYDDLIVDRNHAEDISRHVAAEHLVARGAGHPALKLLARARLLGPTLHGRTGRSACCARRGGWSRRASTPMRWKRASMCGRAPLRRRRRSSSPRSRHGRTTPRPWRSTRTC